MEVKGHTVIILNPGSYIIPDRDEIVVHVYMICEDKKVADQVATYEMPLEEIQAYQIQKAIRLKKSEKKSHTILDNIDTDENEDDDDDLKSIDQDAGGYTQDDDEFLESDYNLLPEAMNLMQITMNTIEDNQNITNHIVVCGIHPSIYYFLLPLRAKYLKELQYVVILSPDPPTNEMWDYLSRFPKLIYIKVYPLLYVFIYL